MNRRIILDIPEETCQSLTIMALAEGKSIKSYLETILVSKAKALNGENIYHQLLNSESEGNMEVSEKERKEFEKWF